MQTVDEIREYLDRRFEIVGDVEPFRKPEVLDALNSVGVPIVARTIDIDAFRSYLEKSDAIYTPAYKKAFGEHFVRKALEHFVSFELMGIAKGQSYMDVASSGSNVPEIMTEHFGLVDVWKQDLSYPEGVDAEKRVIGSNAADIPVDGSAFDRIALHCSFEHFEGDTDTGFVVEVARILRPGGKACILPLYMNVQYHILSNLELMQVRGIPQFEPDSPIYLQERPHNHFGRFYDAKSLNERVIEPARQEGMSATVYDVETTHIAYGIGTNLALLLENPSL